ncbi:MAG: inositol monophosphatase [Actinobacteria bacterium]|nr:inositol monophosphatase [Actinomycetota bacterium]MBU1494791.1 inositol monophosphatase [Actinomycetota bacterium]
MVSDIDIAIRAARAGAAIVAAGFRSVTAADMKGVVDPVTEVDRAAEAAVVAVISEALPDDGILAEEGSAAEAFSGRRWVIDPLDGTVNFIHGIPQVAVSVALEDADGVLVGVIVDPLRNEEFTASRGEGAFLDGSPMRVSTRALLGDSIIATGFPYDRRDHGSAYAVTVGAVLEAAQGVRRLGSAALDLAWVAAGRYDGYWEFSLSPWDMKAGILLVAEAGGMLSNSAGGAIDPTDLVVTNGLIHEELRRVVAANRPGHLPPAAGAAS